MKELPEAENQEDEVKGEESAEKPWEQASVHEQEEAQNLRQE